MNAFHLYTYKVNNDLLSIGRWGSDLGRKGALLVRWKEPTKAGFKT
mgnify:CR=1|jgi:hypothetical protein